MRIERILFVTFMTVGSFSACLAAETISYRYDAKGRIVKVVRTGTVNNNLTYDFTHDKANNRTRVTVTNSPN